MVAFNSFARLPMLRWSVCSLMSPSSPAAPSRRRPPGSGRAAAGRGSAGGRAGLPLVADGHGVRVAAVAAGGHPDVVAQAAGGSEDGSDGVVHGAHCRPNDPGTRPMPGPAVASATATARSEEHTSEL